MKPDINIVTLKITVRRFTIDKHGITEPCNKVRDGSRTGTIGYSFPKTKNTSMNVVFSEIAKMSQS